MAILRPLIAVLILSLFSSCAKFTYLTEQGWGQLKLLTNSKANEEVLKDKSVSNQNKEKIKRIAEYKKFFYSFWERKSGDIYSKTVLLDSDAVTFLVISSKPNEIKAKKECFPIVGCFPYLGFFKKSSALEYKRELEKNGNDTYIRRVLAYSTLGRFDDPILSTFFLYDEFELAETIFHELFHTIFFAKDEVELNGNLANFFGKALVYEYFGKDNSRAKTYYDQIKRRSGLFSKIKSHATKLDTLLKEKDWKKKKKAYINQTFLSDMKTTCNDLEIKNCWPLKLKWNSATFAAFMTYEKGQDQIRKFMSKFDGDLKRLFSFIQKSYEDYKKQSKIKSFEKYILNNSRSES